MKRFAAVAFILLILGGCAEKKPTNRFSDPALEQIANFQDRRISGSLSPFLHSKNPVYRAAACIGFASVQDTSVTRVLGSLLLEDPDSTVRVNAAFALGQTGGIAAVNALIPALHDRDSHVVREVLEALGKTATGADIDLLKNYHAEDTLVQEGLAWAYYRIALRNLADSVVVNKVSEFLTMQYRSGTRLAASHFFARARVSGVSFEKNLVDAALHDPLNEVRMAATSGLRKLKSDQVLEALKNILQNEKDYRVKVNAARALQVFPFEKIKDALIVVLTDSNAQVSVAAAEMLKSSLKVADADIIKLARTSKNVRVQTSLYEAVFATGKYPPELVTEAMGQYKLTKSDYEKSWWIASLSKVSSTYHFLANELVEAKSFVLRTAAAQALTDLNHNKDFPHAAKNEFVEIYRRAIAEGDPAVVGIVATALGDSLLGYKNNLKDLAFLYKAKVKLQLPRDVESLQPLLEAIAYLEGKAKPAALSNTFNHHIDWKLIKNISRDQRVRIHTSQGDIIIRLFVEEAPGSVANFIDLINQRYFDDKTFHRVVPNFVIQTGCNRGDGYGSEDYSIRSEFSKIRYKTGSVGMASAGKDTEGTQWFITHSPTPHLDGRYTIFAEVVKGMDVVDKIGVGDLILGVRLTD